jgi:tetratricopeptide (TPR) repeat protein
VDTARLLLRLWVNPVAAMSEILDRGSLLFASTAVLAASLLLSMPLRGQLPFSFYSPLLVLAVVYVPGILLLAAPLAGAAFRRDYAPLLTCTAMAAAAAGLLPVAAAWTVPEFAGWAMLAALAHFVVLMFFAIRTVFGAGNGMAALLVGLSWIPLAAAVFFWGPLRMLLGWLASPFFLFYAWYYLSSEIGQLGAGLRGRQHFRRMLEAAAVNPHDAEAQYQLGLIYLERRHDSQALEHFRKAVEIDPRETDAHYQLGRIARRQGRLADALKHFQPVVHLDERHSQHEILRETGAVYLAARQYGDALRELALFVEQRPYDPEGLCSYGQALEGAGRTDEARAAYQRAIDAVQTAPRYRQRAVSVWGRLAQRRLRAL